MEAPEGVLRETMRKDTVLSSAHSPEHCRAALRTALRGAGREEPRGVLWGRLFRVVLSEKPRFGNRTRLQYTVYGAIREGENGRAEIFCRRFSGMADPFRFLIVYALVLFAFSLRPDRPLRVALPWLAACTLLACLLVGGGDALACRLYRREERDAMMERLDAFLRRTFDAAARR